MADKSKIIIIKKVKKNHEGSHGGSWKVAYADFVTAMMAFFLLLWLITMSSPEKRAVLAQYFKHFSVFEKSGRSCHAELHANLQREDARYGTVHEVGQGGISPEELKDRLQKAVEEKMRGVKDQVLVDFFEGGIRIQIVDTEGSSMFPLGSAQPNERARDILRLVTDNIKDTPNRIAIEGHTDSAPFKGAQIHELGALDGQGHRRLAGARDQRHRSGQNRR
ncbi:MAG: hypothetical protein MZV70_00395 [Desulfobacterales bacterium]|nr:hypothetical protein [Desulfobacterales bacterium]